MADRITGCDQAGLDYAGKIGHNMHILQKKVICMAKQSQTEFARRRQALLEDSLLNLLETKRFSEITVKDICQEADIPRRTFYHYFECKEDVLDALVDDLMMDCYTQVQFEFFAGAAVLKESFERMFCFWQGENRRKLDALIKNGLEARLQNHASNWIRSEQVSFFRDDTMDPKFEQIGTMVGSAGFFSLLFYWSRNNYQETPEQMARYAVWVLPQASYFV